jgi:hypothetical protein
LWVGRSPWVAGSTKTRYNTTGKSNKEYSLNSCLWSWGNSPWCCYTGKNRDLHWQSKSTMSYMTNLRTKSPMTQESRKPSETHQTEMLEAGNGPPV